jgi:hypothetical protein
MTIIHDLTLLQADVKKLIAAENSPSVIFDKLDRMLIFHKHWDPVTLCQLNKLDEMLREKYQLKVGAVRTKEIYLEPA